LTASPLPKRLHGTSTDCSIRPLSSRERLEIEDQFFRTIGVKSSLDSKTTGIVVSQGLAQGSSTAEYATLIEFVLAIITVSGFGPIKVAATFNGTSCADAVRRPPLRKMVSPPVFSRSLPEPPPLRGSGCSSKRAGTRATGCTLRQTALCDTYEPTTWAILLWISALALNRSSIAKLRFRFGSARTLRM